MIKLKRPLNGEKISLLTDVQLAFLQSDRKNIATENFDYLNLKRQDTADYSFPQGVKFEWDAPAESTIQISETESFDKYCSKTGNQACSVENFKCGTRYFWRVACNGEFSEIFYFDTNAECPRFVRIDGLTNVRDCGGYKTQSEQRIKQGLLYRGSEMNSHVNITTDGLKTMREVLNIKSVLDLRGDTEIVEDVYHGNYANIPARAYSNWFGYPANSRQLFSFFAEEKNYPIYFHCWGGADRTGTLAFLLGALLGVDSGDLIADYEITSLSIWGVRSRNSELFSEFLKKFNEIKGGTLQEKAKNYLISCDISEKQIENFMSIMLE